MVSSKYLTAFFLLNGYASANGASGDLSLNNYSGEFNVDIHEAVPSNTVVLFRINSKQLTENIALKSVQKNTTQKIDSVNRVVPRDNA